MGIKLIKIMWSFFTGNVVKYGQIVWDDFLQYILKEVPREDATELTFSRLWSLCISELHKDARLDMGDDSTLFFTCDLKRYTLSKDQKFFLPIRRLPRYILEPIRLTTVEVDEV